MLTAFLIILPFDSGARDYLDDARLTLLLHFFLGADQSVLLSGPAVQHRLMSPLISRERLKCVATRQIVAGSFALALVFALGTNLVITALTGQLLGVVASVTMACLILPCGACGRWC